MRQNAEVTTRLDFEDLRRRLPDAILVQQTVGDAAPEELFRVAPFLFRNLHQAITCFAVSSAKRR